MRRVRREGKGKRREGEGRVGKGVVVATEADGEGREISGVTLRGREG